MITRQTPYGDTEMPQNDKQQRLYLWMIFPLCVLGVFICGYLVRKFRHDIVDKIWLMIQIVIFRYCIYVEIQYVNALDQQSSSTSSSSPSSNSSSHMTRLKRKLSFNIVNEISSRTSLPSRTSDSSKPVPWDNVIAKDAIRIAEDILMNSESKDVPLSTPPSSILDTSSMSSSSDSNRSVILVDRCTQVSDPDQSISQSEDLPYLTVIFPPTWSQ